MKYTIRNKRSKKTKEIELSMSEVDKWEKDNPKFEIVCGAPPIHSGTGLGLKTSKPTDSFKDKLRQIDKKMKGNTIKKYVDI